MTAGSWQDRRKMNQSQDAGATAACADSEEELPSIAWLRSVQSYCDFSLPPPLVSSRGKCKSGCLSPRPHPRRGTKKGCEEKHFPSGLRVHALQGGSRPGLKPHQRRSPGICQVSLPCGNLLFHVKPLGSHVLGFSSPYRIWDAG